MDLMTRLSCFSQITEYDLRMISGLNFKVSNEVTIGYLIYLDTSMSPYPVNENILVVCSFSYLSTQAEG